MNRHHLSHAIERRGIMQLALAGIALLGLLAMSSPAPAQANGTSGTVVAWGWDHFGQSSVPSGLSDVTAIAAGGFHSLALKSDGSVVAWGSTDYGQTTVPSGLSDVTAIAAGLYYSMALKSDGSVIAWGRNDYGQSTVPGAALSGVTAISAGSLHSLALKSDGAIVAWGDNDYGQTSVPTGLSDVTAIAAGAYHSLALKSDGAIVAWGANTYGGTSVPTGLSGMTAIAAGAYHSLAVTSDGSVVAWGWNDHGQSTVPTGLSDVTAVAAGFYHSLALKSDGSVVAWGSDSLGQASVPIGLTGVTAIAAGANHNLAFRFDTTSPGSVSIEINGGASWTNNLSVSLNLSATDNVGITSYRLAESQAGLDGATAQTATSQQTFSASDVPFTLPAGDHAARSVWLRVCDAAGNCADASDTIGLDTTKPVITGQQDPLTNENGWNNTSVAVTFTCADALSGIATDTVAGATVATEGAGQSVTNSGTCVDKAGNVADPVTISSINVDLTPPVVTVSDNIQVTAPSAAGIVVAYGAATVTDNLSDAPVPQCVPLSGSVFLPGVNTVTCTSTDGAGNVGSNSFTVTVNRDMVQACLFGGALGQLKLLPSGQEPSGSCGRGELVVLYQGLDVHGCVFAGSLSQVGTSAPGNCGRGELVSLAAGADLYGCLYAGSLTRVGTSASPCSRGLLVGFERADR